MKSAFFYVSIFVVLVIFIDIIFNFSGIMIENFANHAHSSLIQFIGEFGFIGLTLLILSISKFFWHKIFFDRLNILLLVFLFVLFSALCGLFHMAFSFLALRLCKEVSAWRAAYRHRVTGKN